MCPVAYEAGPRAGVEKAEKRRGISPSQTQRPAHALDAFCPPDVPAVYMSHMSSTGTEEGTAGMGHGAAQHRCRGYAHAGVLVKATLKKKRAAQG